MNNFDEFIKKAELNLNESLRHFEEAPNTLAQEFLDLKLQACIFQYDICAEMVALLRNKPQGFACAVALKGIVLRLFEYDILLNKSLIPRLLAFAKARNIVIDRDAIKLLRKTWKAELNELKTWHEVRNNAAGHYGEDLAKQVKLLKLLNVDGVLTVVRGFLSFNMGLLVLLRTAGSGAGSDV
jgi:hypothetical protein